VARFSVSKLPCSLPIQSCHGARNRDTILGFLQIQFEANIQQSKKQQQAVKKQVLGKASYNTRAKGTRPPSSS